jgi:glycerol uptake facilitator protein
MTPFCAEVIGTFFLILIGGGVVANVVLTGTNGNKGGWMVITTAWALAVFLGVIVAGPHSGGHLNPAVSVGLALAGKFNWEDVPLYVLAQFIGATVGAFCVWLFYRLHFEQTDDAAAKKAVFCTTPAIRNYSSNLFSEVVGTFVLIFAVLSFTDASILESEQLVGLGSLGAVPVAFVVWGVGLALGGTTGYAINPVRDLCPRIVHALVPISGKADSDWSYAWVPVVGPILGAALAAWLFLGLN